MKGQNQGSKNMNPNDHFQSTIDDSIVTYMVERQWTADQKTQRKRYLNHLAQNSKSASVPPDEV